MGNHPLLDAQGQYFQWILHPATKDIIQTACSLNWANAPVVGVTVLFHFSGLHYYYKSNIITTSSQI